MTDPKTAAAAYDSWAAYYDLTDADRAPFIDFYVGLLERGTRSLLDLGCGTGTITIALSRRLRHGNRGSTARRLVGVDASPEMLRIARARDRSIEWILGDMGSPPVEGPFDIVISCFNTLQHLLADEDLAQAFRAVRRVLSPEGTFAFDVYQPNVDYISVPQVDRLARSVTDEDGRRLEIRESTEYDSLSRILTIDWRLCVAGEQDRPPLARTRFALRQYFAADVERLLAAASLSIRERHGDLDRSPFTDQSKKQVVVCGPA
jgi:SAM-dependent methyltransferase